MAKLKPSVNQRLRELDEAMGNFAKWLAHFQNHLDLLSVRLEELEDKKRIIEK